MLARGHRIACGRAGGVLLVRADAGRAAAAAPPARPGDLRQVALLLESLREMGGERAAAASSVRLFMMPGTNHCAGGDGPNTFDRMRVIEQWVEHGQAPERIPATHSTNGVVDRTRPLCPYPQVAKYKGSGHRRRGQLRVRGSLNRTRD